MTKEKKPVNPRTRMGGNKEIPIDWKEVERLAICGCSGRQVAEAMGINYDTLYKRCKKDQKMMWGEYSSRKKAKVMPYCTLDSFRWLLRKTEEC